MALSGKMTRGRIWIVLAAAVAAFLLGWALRGCGEHGAENEFHDHAAETGEIPGADEEEVVWTCSMHPQIQLPEPGQCPICFMDLIPVAQDDGGSEKVSLRQVRMSERARRLAEVRTATVVRRTVGVQTRLVGKVDYDETRLGSITAWMGGRIDDLRVDFTGAEVRRGQAMASIYSPELLTAQAELIQAEKAMRDLEKSRFERVRETAARTARAAREKLRLLGLSQSRIDRVLERGAPSDHVTLTSPMSGVVIELHVREGQYVQTGTAIYTIADLSRVWVMLEAYESDLPWIEMGEEVSFTTEAHPGRVFTGEVSYIDTVVDEKTRTVSVRLAVGNPEGRLKPGMFVSAVQRPGPRQEVEADAPLVIPATAALITGKRAVVYVAVPGQEGVYEGREVVLGPRAGDFYIVREGLSEGEEVVTRGNFKIDSAVQIQARPSMMTPQTGGGGGAVQTHQHGSPEGEGQTRVEMAESMQESRVEAPFAFLRQLAPLAAEFEAVEAAVQTSDLTAMHAAYKSFYDRIRAVDPTAITDADAALLWKELSMLLRNDSFLGARVDDPAEGRRLLSTMRGHFLDLRGAFDIASVTAADDRLEIPAEVNESLQALFRDYLALQSSLAGDDFEAAKKAFAAVRESLDSVTADQLDPAARKVWNETASQMRSGFEVMEKAASIQDLRNGFEPLTLGLSKTLERLDVVLAEPVFELYCPMVDGNRGAPWLQSDQEVRNPYFGAAMLGCGEVRREVLVPGEAAREAPFDVPEAFSRQLEDLLVAYLDLQDALAGDDEPGARVAVQKMRVRLGDVDMALLQGAVHDLWMEYLEEMRAGLAVAEGSGSISDIRQGFEPLSMALAEALVRMGGDVSGPVYELFCPMALDNAGATWLQRTTDVRNPYFGAAMFACGEVRREILPER